MMRDLQSVDRNLVKSLILYYAVACGWAWIAWSPLLLGTTGFKILHITASLPIFTCIATLGPLFGCFIAIRFQTGSWQAVRLLPSPRRRWIWMVIGPLLVLFSLFIVFPLLIVKESPNSWHIHPLALSGLWIPMFNYNLLGGPLFEEFGWRGFLQPRLQRIFPAWIAAIVVGSMWALWHWPLFFVAWTSAPPLIFLAIEVGLSIIIASAFNASGGAVVVAILMHSAFNASSRFLGPYLGESSTRDYPSAESYIAFSFAIVAALCVFFSRKANAEKSISSSLSSNGGP